MHACEDAEGIALLQTSRRLEAHKEIFAGDHGGGGLANQRLHRHAARGQPPFTGAAGKGKLHRRLALGIGDNGRQPMAGIGQFAAHDGVLTGIAFAAQFASKKK